MLTLIFITHHFSSTEYFAIIFFAFLKKKIVREFGKKIDLGF